MLAEIGREKPKLHCLTFFGPVCRDGLESGERSCVACFLVALLEKVELELHRVVWGPGLSPAYT